MSIPIPEGQLTKREKKEQARLAKEQRRKESAKKQQRGQMIMGAVVLVIVAAVLAGVWYGSKGPAAPLTDGTVRVEEGDWLKGNPEAPHTIVEYSDFECPACASTQQVITRLLEEHGEQVRLAYRHFPLESIHDAAEPAARAAEAAGLQGKFWEMHDLLYEKQSEWSKNDDLEGSFAGYAGELGLEAEQFLADYESDAVRAAVASDAEQARVLKLGGTPSFFLDGAKIQNPRSYEEWVELIQ